MSLYRDMAPLEIRLLRRAFAARSPPVNGCADSVPGGHRGGVGSPREGSALKGARRADLRASRVEGMLKGTGWGGINAGRGGRRVGVRRALRGRSLSGSRDLRCVVYTFGRSEISVKGRSRLKL